MEYNGFPNQCKQYRSFDHLVSKCPLHRRPVEERISEKVKRSKDAAGTSTHEKTPLTKDQPSLSRHPPSTSNKPEQRTVWQSIPNQPIRASPQTPIIGRKGYRTTYPHVALGSLQMQLDSVRDYHRCSCGPHHLQGNTNKKMYLKPSRTLLYHTTDP